MHKVSVINIICISETWFVTDVPDCAYGIDGYNLFRSDRISQAGGGIAIFIRTGLRCKLLSKAEANNSFDYILL